MATKNFFDLLGDDENEDPAQVVVRANSLAAADAKPAANAANAATKKPAAAAAKLPSKPAPPSEAGECVCVWDWRRRRRRSLALGGLGS